MYSKRLAITCFFYLLLFLCSCKKLVEIDGPKTNISSKNVFNNNATAIGTVTALYVNLSSGTLSRPSELTGLSCIAGLSADELNYYSAAGNATLSNYYLNMLTNLTNGFGSGYWSNAYGKIYEINAAIEGLIGSENLNPMVKKQLLGEVKFMRAFYYFYLVNLYGDVPLVLSTDYTVNALVTKSTKPLIYQQILSDLKESQSLLNDKYVMGDCISTYVNGLEERVRPSKWSATALLARTYLFMEKWSDAETQASQILQNTTQFGLVGVDQVFLKNNREAIWQLQPVQNGYNTQEANFFILPTTGPSFINPVYLNNDLVNAFELDDLRKSNWINSVAANSFIYYYPSKYRLIYSNIDGAPVKEYSTVMRLAEQVLIRAEARAEQNNLSGAIQDLDMIRNRANLSLINDVNPGIDKADLLKIILKERQLEFFTEWGHRWLDLKRTGKIDEVMAIVTPKKGNGAGWKTYQKYYPIDLNELKSNPNLLPTPGY